MPDFDPGLPLEMLPQLLLDVDVVERNISVKEDWARAHSMVLAPHIKTTMTADIVARQLPGAWGVTAATTGQAALAIGWGARRILLANEVLHPPQLRSIRQWLADSRDLEIYLLADSSASVLALAEAFDGASRPLHVLVDVGTGGGRTGIRTAAEAGPLARQIAGAPGLVLAGVCAYEGVAPNVRTPENLARVDAHCLLARQVFTELRPLVQVPEPVFSIGGSAFQDRAAQFLPEAPAVSVLRSGCYVVHDHGTYADVSPVPGLQPAVVVRTQVISVPEPGLAVLNAGKRELAYDAGLPVIVSTYRDGALLPGARGTVAKLFDHHAVLAEAEGLQPGDLVDLGISHPCSVFDRWRNVVAVRKTDTETWHPQF